MKSVAVKSSAIRAAISVGALLFSVSLLAQQRLEMEGTSIIGNKELPKVLYIVPWKSAEPISLVTPPFESVLDQAPRPVDRSTFKRRVDFYHDIHSSTDSRP